MQARTSAVTKASIGGNQGCLLGLVLDLGKAGQNSLVEWMVLFQASKLRRSRFGRLLFQDLGQFDTLVVAIDILEPQGLFDSTKQRVDLVATFSELGGGSNKAFLAPKLAERSTSNTFDNVFQGGVRETGNDSIHVFLLFLPGNVVLFDDESGSFRKNVQDNTTDSLISHGLVDGFLSRVVSIVGSSSVTGVDSVELALDVWLKVVDPVDSLDIRVAKLAEWSLLDGPFIELLDLDVQTGIGILCRDNSIDGGVGKASTGGKGLDAGGVSVVLDETVEGVGSANGILAGNNGNWCLGGAGVDALGDGRGDELEDSGANGAGNDIGSRDFVNNIVHMSLRIESTVIGDGLGVLAISADLGDVVGVGLLESLDNAVHHVDEDDFIARLVQELSDEATANVAAAKMNGLLSHVDECF